MIVKTSLRTSGLLAKSARRLRISAILPSLAIAAAITGCSGKTSGAGLDSFFEGGQACPVVGIEVDWVKGPWRLCDTAAQIGTFSGFANPENGTIDDIRRQIDNITLLEIGAGKVPDVQQTTERSDSVIWNGVEVLRTFWSDSQHETHGVNLRFAGYPYFASFTAVGDTVPDFTLILKPKP